MGTEGALVLKTKKTVYKSWFHHFILCEYVENHISSPSLAYNIEIIPTTLACYKDSIT